MQTRNRTRNPVTETLTGTCASPAVRLCLRVWLGLGIISSLRVEAFMLPPFPTLVQSQHSSVCQLSVARSLSRARSRLPSLSSLTFMRRRKMIRKRFVINFNNRKYRFLPGPRAARLLVTLLPSVAYPPPSTCLLPAVSRPAQFSCVTIFLLISCGSSMLKLIVLGFCFPCIGSLLSLSF